MTRFARWWRDLLERWSERYFEGPEPPARLTEMAIAFAEMHPNATRREWVAFAAAHARNSYSSGYARGYEYVERDPDFFKDRSPDEAAAQLDPHEFEWSPDIALTRPDDAVPEFEEPDASVLLRQLAEKTRGEK